MACNWNTQKKEYDYDKNFSFEGKVISNDKAEWLGMKCIIKYKDEIVLEKTIDMNRVFLRIHHNDPYTFFKSFIREYKIKQILNENR